jgi:hypothetical protein
MKSAARSSLPRIVIAMTVAMTAILCVGCKRSTVSSPSAGGSGGGGANSASGSADVATATGSGGVNVTGNVLTYQNVHVEVPWNVADVASLVKISQEAASGAGLTLTDGKSTLSIASDGRSIRLNGHAYGELKAGDHVVLSKEGKLTVNDVERAAAPGPATTQGGSSSH